MEFLAEIDLTNFLPIIPILYRHTWINIYEAETF